MSPSQIAKRLEYIAAKIENSRNPRRDLVVFDLKQVLAAAEDFDPYASKDFEKPSEEVADQLIKYLKASGITTIKDEVLGDGTVKLRVHDHYVYVTGNDSESIEPAASIADKNDNMIQTSILSFQAVKDKLLEFYQS